MDYDGTALPDVYVAARTLAADTLAVWREAIRDAVPPGAVIGRVIDLGCGAGRFSRVLAEAFGAPVVGVDPSLRMLAGRDAADPPPARFLAGAAEALPLATASAGLVFLSMVYHHLRVPAALAEIRRVLRPGGHAVVRNVTRELVDGYEFLRFFPEARVIDLARMPAREALAREFQAAGLRLHSHRAVRHRLAAGPREYYRKVSLRALSSLRLIADEAFERGLRAFERHCAAADAQPIDELVDLFVFAAPVARRDPSAALGHSGTMDR